MDARRDLVVLTLLATAVVRQLDNLEERETCSYYILIKFIIKRFNKVYNQE